MNDNEPVAHMIDVDPVLFLNCSKQELLICGVGSIALWFVVLILLFILFIGSFAFVILVPVASLVFGIPSAYLCAKYMGTQKLGKPHMWFPHTVETRFLSTLKKDPPFIRHRGHYAIGRTHRDD